MSSPIEYLINFVERRFATAILDLIQAKSAHLRELTQASRAARNAADPPEAT